MATPSLNETQRMHWAKRRRLGRVWYLFLLAAFGRMEQSFAPGKKRVVIDRRGRRMLDKDNAYGGCKLVVDALKSLRAIDDDDAANLDLEVVQTKLAKGETPHTVVTIEDVAGLGLAKIPVLT